MKPMNKQIINTDYGTFEYVLSVQGSPAIVLINGGSGPVEGWHRLFPELAREYTVLAYNRLGIGKSSQPTGPQHGAAITAALKQLLDDLHVPPPYVLVGHSLGGLYANLLARQFPEQIAGVLMLEASHPQDLKINDTQPAVIRVLNRLLGRLDTFVPSRRWNEVHYVEETARQIQQAAQFPDKPLFVITGMKKSPFMPQHVLDIRLNHQRELVQLSRYGKQILAKRSGHFPQFTEPELVLQTIRDCISCCANRT